MKKRIGPLLLLSMAACVAAGCQSLHQSRVASSMEQIMVHRFDLHEASFIEALIELQDYSKRLAYPKGGATFSIDLLERDAWPKDITLTWTNMSLLDALTVFTETTETTWSAEGKKIVIRKKKPFVWYDEPYNTNEVEQTLSGDSPKAAPEE